MSADMTCFEEVKPTVQAVQSVLNLSQILLYACVWPARESRLVLLTYFRLDNYTIVMVFILI